MQMKHADSLTNAPEVSPGLKTIPPMIVFDGLRYGIRFYRTNDDAWENLTTILKSYRGIWNPKARMWIYSKMEDLKSSLEKVVLGVQEEKSRGDLRDMLLSRLAAATETPRSGWFSPYLQACLWSFSDEGFEGSALSVAYDRLLVRLVKSLESHWWQDEGVWLIENKTMEEVSSLVLIPGGLRPEDILFSEIPYDDNAGKVFREKGFLKVGVSADFVPGEHQKKEESEGEGGRRKAAVLMFSKPLERLRFNESDLEKSSIEADLLPHQEEGVRHLLSMNSSLLADDMGLGKTRTATVASHLAGKRICIVCPASLKENWKHEILMVRPDDRIHVVNSGSSIIPETARWVICNYETLGPAMSVRNSFDVVVVDEAHYLKEIASERTMNVMLLSRDIPRRYLLTATPILNRAEEIWSLMALGGHPLGRIPWEEFVDTYTKSTEAREELSDRINEWMLRRLKDKTLSLPGRYEINPELVLSPEFKDLYDSISDDPTKARLGKFTPLRQLIEQAKIDFTVETLVSMSEDSKAIVFCEYLPNVDALVRRCEEEGLGTVRLTGKESLRIRNEAKEAFQNDPDVRVFVTTIRAGGVGLTLTAANIVLLMSRPWTPALKEQAECRADRLGQTRRVCVINPIMKNTIDEDIVEMLKVKGEVIEDVLADRFRKTR